MKKQPIWSPTTTQIEHSQLNQFIKYVNSQENLSLFHYNDIYHFSITEKEKFWSYIWDFTQIIGTKGNKVVQNVQSFQNVQWFPEAQLNYAENLLSNQSDETAILSNIEHYTHKSITHQELYSQVSKVIQGFYAHGIQKGDRIALFVNNEIETVVCALAASAIGAIASLCSTDFGVKGATDRFTQIEPTCFIYSQITHYNGKKYNQTKKADEILNALPKIKLCICIDNFEANEKLTHSLHILFSDILQNYPSKQIEFERVPFSHPLYIAYSSGTTGKPKCIVHSHGGILIQHKKEHTLHCDIRPEDKVFYYTTCGWMMWQWLLSSLASRATIVLYQGSPFYPNSLSLLHYLDKIDTTFLGTSAKFIDSIRKLNEPISEKFKFNSLRMIGSTGSPLSTENYEFVYKKWKSNLILASLSGGTDILSCFVLGCPIKPVISGEIQCVGLGMQMDSYNENGESVRDEPGELVCTAPFPSMPVCFWNDPNGLKFKESYFEKFPNIWCHGDWATITKEGGCIIHGRSDATLNPGGVRIGTAEIYRQIEIFDEILESVVTEHYAQNDSRIVLFVKLKENVILTNTLIKAIKEKIRHNCSPRHVPALILPVSDIPKTKSGKIMELAVKNTINNLKVPYKESMQNPESLSCFQNVLSNTF